MLEIERLEYLRLLEIEAMRVEQLRTSLPQFIQQAFRTLEPVTPYSHNWHIDVIAEYLLACERREIKRLIINMPPRAMKSIAVTVSWPAWLLGHNPSEKILTGSYAQDLTLKHSNECRIIMRSAWYQQCFPKTRLQPGNDRQDYYTTTKRGYRFATSVSSRVTGFGSNILIIDDPLSAIQANSEKECENSSNWFNQAMMSRLDDKQNGVIVLVMQRLVPRDLTGVLDEMGGWEKLLLPATFEKRTVIDYGGKQKILMPGDLLHPSRLTQPVLDEAKKQLGAFGFSAQYQQKPISDEGGILKRAHWKQWGLIEVKDETGKVIEKKVVKEPLPICHTVVQFYDTAFEDKQENDESARTTWGIFERMSDTGDKEQHAILLEAWHDRVLFPELKQSVIDSHKLEEPDYIFIEKKASGMPLYQELRRAQLPVRYFDPKTNSKTVRAHAVSPILEAGHIWYVDKIWSQEVISQCSAFPKGDHDDIVDTVTSFMLWFRHRFILGLPDDDKTDYIAEHARQRRKEKRYYG